MTESQTSFIWHEPSAPAAGRTTEQLLPDIEVIELAYREGLFGGTVHEVFPNIDRSSIAWRVYFTLPCAINYQRNSESLWRAALRTFDDPETRFVFDCSQVVQGREAFKFALIRHGLAVQRDKHTDIWFTIAATFADVASGDPAELFSRLAYDVRSIKDFVLERKRSFPYLSGPKLLNYWLYMLTVFTELPLRNREAISVVPDLHVKRASVALGLINEAAAANTDFVAETWSNLLRGTQFAPADLHAPLWRWSRAGMPSVQVLRERLARLQ